MKMFACFLLSLMAPLLTAQHIADFEEYNLAVDTFDNGSDGSGGFTSGGIFLPNNYNREFAAWTGWALSSKTDTLSPGYLNQYSAIAGRGVEQSNTYAVAYALEPTVFKLANGAKIVESLYICNATYPFLSMRDGDAFSKKFGGPSGRDPDYFLVTIKKYQDGILAPDSINFYLADFRPDDPAEDYMVDDWTFIDLSSLGLADSLSFSLSSSDVGIFGMNTPAYFCVDKIVTREDIISTSIREILHHPLRVFPNPVSSIVQFEFPDEVVGQLFFYNMEGKLVREFQSVSANQQIGLSDFQQGIYFYSLITPMNRFTGSLIKN